jgi:hypothetical protein
MRYTIECSEHQARVIVDALDLYSRIGCGQLEEIPRMWDHFYCQSPGIDLSAMRERIKQAKACIGVPPDGHNGIFGRGVNDIFRDAYDIQQAVRNRIAVTKDPDGCTTWHSILKSGEEPLPMVVAIQEEDHAKA